MWTRKGGLLIFLGTFSIVMGLILSDFQLMILALVIFTFFLLVLVMPRPDIKVLRKTTNTTLFENDDLQVDLKIDKVQQGFGTVEIFDRIPEYAELQEGINHMIYNPQESQTMEYSLQFPVRGYYSVGPTFARISDHFNIFYHDQVVHEKEPIAIFPHVAGLNEFKFTSKKNIHYPGEFLTPQAGASTEFYHIRDYIKGDPFKKINWKVYARKRELMVNEYEKENICDSLVFLDARNNTNIGSVVKNTLEYNVKLALAVSNFLIMHRNQVGVVVYNDEIKVLPPKPGIRHQNEILRLLTGVYAKGWTDLNIALQYAKPFMRSKTTLILISNLEYDQTFLSSVEWLSAFGYRVIIISPSAIRFELNFSEYAGPLSKFDLFRLGRENFIRELRNLGASVIEYSPEDPIDEILELFSKEILR